MASTNLPAIGVCFGRLKGFAMGCLYCFQVYVFILTVATVSGYPLIATNKLSLATWGSYCQRDHMGPGTYAFGYDIEDPVTGNIQFRQEERHPNGTITGTYGYVDAAERPVIVTYISDEYGYRAKLEVEGEPIRYFPDKPTFFGDVLQQQQTDTSAAGNYLSDENDVVSNSVPLDEHHRVPSTHRLDYPSYYKYIKARTVSK